MGNKKRRVTPVSLLDNPRFYVIVATVLLSLLIASSFRSVYGSDVIYFSRLGRAFAWFSVLYWYLALLATPLKGVFGEAGFMKTFLHVRRALGVSAAYFALLHAVIAVSQQMGGISNIQLLPSTFQWSFLWGLFALIILIMLAITSFDKVVNYMTFPEWKRLHRTIYVGSLFAMLHVWLIGQTVATTPVQSIIFVAAVLLLGLEAIRVSRVLVARNKQLVDYAQFIAVLFVAVTLSGLVLGTRSIQNYSQVHESHALDENKQSLGGGHDH